MKKLNALLKETKNAFSDFVKEYDFSLQENVSPKHIENDFNLFLSDNEFEYATMLDLFETLTNEEKEMYFSEINEMTEEYIANLNMKKTYYLYDLKQEIITKNKTTIAHTQSVAMFYDEQKAIEEFDYIKNDFQNYCLSKGEFLATYIDKVLVTEDCEEIIFDYDNIETIRYHAIEKI